jgi:hypothetical protein
MLLGPQRIGGKGMARSKKGSGGDGDEPNRIERARAAFAPFLADNSLSTIEEVQLKSGTSLRVLNPWGESAFALKVPDNMDELAEALNAVRLPLRLSAVWHKDTNDLEVIWTALNLSKGQREIDGRAFVFNYKGRSHDCEFGESSRRLTTIACQFAPVTMSSTNYRNLQSFAQYAVIPEERRGNFGLDKPRSFWIRNIKWNEDDIFELITNLNFYLTYFDDRSPMVLLHEPPVKSDKPIQRTRYIHGEFPKEIHGDGLDGNLLSFWISADDGDPMMRFLLYFRIIEYAATHYVDSTIRAELRKVLLAPNLKSDINGGVEKIVGAVNLNKIDDTQRFKAVVRQCVDPCLLWRDIDANMTFFTKDTKFDGGFTVKRLVAAEDTEATFKPRGLETFSDSIRKIRNALSHGKDQETSGVITPTTRNLKLFQPWVHLIATAAGEVVLYKDAS